MATNSKLEVTKRKLQEGYQEFDNGIVWLSLAYYYLLQHHIATSLQETRFIISCCTITLLLTASLRLEIMTWSIVWSSLSLDYNG
jgi:NADH:ubiquinone oxidoreductase subunit B-like Fe-S oxidoreductase